MAEKKTLILKLSCQGKKVALRKIPKIDGEVVKNLSHGDEIEVFSATASGYYQLVDLSV